MLPLQKFRNLTPLLRSTVVTKLQPVMPIGIGVSTTTFLVLFDISSVRFVTPLLHATGVDCKLFLAGECKHGDTCLFRHSSPSATSASLTDRGLAISDKTADPLYRSASTYSTPAPTVLHADTHFEYLVRSKTMLIFP